MIESTCSGARSARCIEEVDIRSHDLRALTLHAVFLPTLGLEPAHHHHFASFRKILSRKLTELSPGHDLVVLHRFLALTAWIHPGTVRCHRKRRHLLAAGS